ncbi:MAG: DUF3596 domain-containing protein [Calothrix sp. C42_A2020_038]|nr:DUF3596 domain-containing protein [Calothrix sp. C42_A2020_038]
MAKQSPKSKSSKGTVQVKTSNDRLQLVFRIAGKRYYLSTGFTDSVANRIIILAYFIFPHLPLLLML